MEAILICGSRNPKGQTAQAADADALKAKKTAENAKNETETEALKQQRALRQLAAARDVAKLEWEITQAGIDATHAKIESGQATARDEECDLIVIGNTGRSGLQRLMLGSVAEAIVREADVPVLVVKHCSTTFCTAVRTDA